MVRFLFRKVFCKVYTRLIALLVMAPALYVLVDYILCLSLLFLSIQAAI